MKMINDTPLLFQGIVYKIFETQVRGTFSFRLFWLMEEVRYQRKDGTEGLYTNYLEFKVIQGHIHKLDNIKEGDVVVVTFSPKGRLWEDKLFQSLEVYKIDVLGFKPPVAPPIVVPEQLPGINDYVPGTIEPSNDLPF